MYISETLYVHATANAMMWWYEGVNEWACVWGVQQLEHHATRQGDKATMRQCRLRGGKFFSVKKRLGMFSIMTLCK